MSRSKKTVNPYAQKELNRLKEEVAQEIGLGQQYKENAYRGHLTSADNGRVGGQMVKRMIESVENKWQQ